MATIVCEYGLLQPSWNVDVLSEQIYKAHTYYNVLVEIERWRRKAILDAQRAFLGIAAEQGRYDAAKARLEALMAQKKRSKSYDKKTPPPSPADIAQAKQEKADASAALKAIKIQMKAVLKPLYEKIDEDAHEKRLDARAHCGVYWCTYLLIEQSVDQAIKSTLSRAAPPKPGKVSPPWEEQPGFRRWTGDGIVGVQIQRGLDAREIFDMTDTRVRIAPLPPNAYDKTIPRGQRNRLQRTTLHMRVASSGPGGREPVWVSWPLFMHRPLPEGAVVKWVRVIRRAWWQIWPYRWWVQITLDVPDAPRKPGNEIVAVNLGWREMENEELRIATWADSNGATGEVRLGASFRQRVEKAEKIRSHRDKLLNDLKVILLAEGVPCEQWRSFSRFHRLLRDVLTDTATTPITPVALQELKEWASRDNHLGWYQRGCHHGALGYRLETYRLFALEMAKRYPIIVVENYDLREIVTDEDRAKEPSAQRVEGSPSEGRAALRSTASRLGCLIIDGVSKQATQQCHVCGDASPWDAAPQVIHTCANGHTWDQDVNNALNMLASAKGLLQTPGALAAPKPKRSAKFAKRHAKKSVTAAP